MTAMFVIFLVVHGLIHFMGFAKAFGYADLPNLTQPISHASGLAWLAAAMLFLLAAVLVPLAPRFWWVAGACGVVVSLAAISAAWSDAKFGAVADIVAAVGVVFGFLAAGPVSLRAAYDRDVAAGVADSTAAAANQLLTESDISPLPQAIRGYLRVTGAIGQPRVRSFAVRMHGRIRGGPQSRWMRFKAEQYNFIGGPARFFYMTASMIGLPMQGYHRYAGATASMRIRAAALAPVANADGPEMTQGETVTMFNDMCVMAPATLVDPRILWTPVDDRVVDASFTNGGHTVRARLFFNEKGELVNFSSHDRLLLSSDGRTLRPVPWSTPLGEYRQFHTARLASGGDARWHEPTGEYAYIELTIDDVRYNVAP